MIFDFYIQDPYEGTYLIEYDGEQHFNPMSFGSTSQTGEEKLQYTKCHDEIKNKWCKNNNIPLIRIPYTSYSNIEIQDLKPSTSNYLLK